MKRHKHGLSHYKVLSCNAGQLIPVMCVEALRGDIWQHRVMGLVRAAPMLAPLMHKVDVRFHTFFVPNRLIWEDWEDFITGGRDGDNASVPPTIEMTYVEEPESGNNHVGMLPDFLGVPPKVNGRFVSALPFRAYTLIYNEYYRDQDLIDPLPLSTASGVDSTTNTALQRIAWEKDYLTSARPFEAKGPSLTLPLGTRAPVLGIGAVNQTYATGPFTVVQSNSTIANYAQGKLINGSPADQQFIVERAAGEGGSNIPNIYADLSDATGVDINTVREFFALQRMQEARARYGSRYTEFLLYYGIKSSDARLQRPEYLGGGKSAVQFSEVLQTTPGDAADDAVGALKGHGIGGARSNRYRHYFEEDGLVITLMSIRPRTMYMQALHRMWSRTNKEMYWQKELEHIGQQEVFNSEVKFDHATPNGRFGFQDRYDEYRRCENTVAGEMRDLLNYWHWAREFETDPSLNEDFVECVPSDRIFAGGEEISDQFYVLTYHSLQARRGLSKVGRSFIF